MLVRKDLYRLVTSFNEQEIQWLKERFTFKPTLHFHYRIFQRKPNYLSFMMIPKDNPYVWNHYNAILTFNPSNLPSEALEILHLISPCRWMVKRLDVAFDYPTPLEDGFMLPPPTSVKIERYKDTLYYGAVKAKCTVCQYDKSKQLKDVYNVALTQPMTRIEFRFKPNLKSIMDYDVTDFEAMSKYRRYVPNTSELRGFRCDLKRLTNGKDNWREIKPNRRKSIRAEVEKHVPDMLHLFLEHIEGDITGFMLENLDFPYTEVQDGYEYAINLLHYRSQRFTPSAS